MSLIKWPVSVSELFVFCFWKDDLKLRKQTLRQLAMTLRGRENIASVNKYCFCLKHGWKSLRSLKICSSEDKHLDKAMSFPLSQNAFRSQR